MRPGTEEVLRGVQASLMTYVLPEVQTDYARTELMLAIALVGIAAGEQDSAIERLVADNDALRVLSGRCGNALASLEAGSQLADALNSLARGSDTSLRRSDLSASNEQLRAAIGQFAVHVQDLHDDALKALRRAVLDRLRTDSEGRSLALMGPRSDG
jgi:hypothetical protein